MSRKLPRHHGRMNTRTMAVSAVAIVMLFATVLLPQAAVSATGIARASASQSDVSELEKSVMLIEMYYSAYVQVPYNINGTVQIQEEEVVAAGICTGWFASADGHIVTAGHCVSNDDARTSILEELVLKKLKQPELLNSALAYWDVSGATKGSPVVQQIYVSQPAIQGSFIKEPTVVQTVNYRPFESGDVALLKLKTDVNTPHLKVADEQTGINSQIVAIGFPGSVGSVTDPSRLRASFKTGTVSQNQISPQGVAGIEINADISGGMSGGPTVNANNEVVGVNSFIINGEEQSFNFVTDTNDLRTFLTQQGVPLESAPSPQLPADPRASDAVQPEAGNGLTWLAVVLLVVTAVGLGVFYFVKRSRKRRGQPASQLTSMPPWASPTDAMPPQTTVATGTGRYCANCGASAKPEARFCGNCGQQL